MIKRKRRTWTQAEEDWLSLNYNHLPLEDILNYLGSKTKSAIFNKVFLLGLTSPKEQNESERFWKRVNKKPGIVSEIGWFYFGECWLWTGAKYPNGYGYFTLDKQKNHKKIVAHKYSYQAAFGEVAKGLFLDHLCRVRDCVRPAHLQPVPPALNFLRGYLKETHCPFGHPICKENTYEYNGRLICKICGLIKPCLPVLDINNFYLKFLKDLPCHKIPAFPI